MADNEAKDDGPTERVSPMGSNKEMMADPDQYRSVGSPNGLDVLPKGEEDGDKNLIKDVAAQGRRISLDQFQSVPSMEGRHSGEEGAKNDVPHEDLVKRKYDSRHFKTLSNVINPFYYMDKGLESIPKSMQGNSMLSRVLTSSIHSNPSLKKRGSSQGQIPVTMGGSPSKARNAMLLANQALRLSLDSGLDEEEDDYDDGGGSPSDAESSPFGSYKGGSPFGSLKGSTLTPFDSTKGVRRFTAKSLTNRGSTRTLRGSPKSVRGARKSSLRSDLKSEEGPGMLPAKARSSMIGASSSMGAIGDGIESLLGTARHVRVLAQQEGKIERIANMGLNGGVAFTSLASGMADWAAHSRQNRKRDAITCEQDAVDDEMEVKRQVMLEKSMAAGVDWAEAAHRQQHTRSDETWLSFALFNDTGRYNRLPRLMANWYRMVTAVIRLIKLTRGTMRFQSDCANCKRMLLRLMFMYKASSSELMRRRDRCKVCGRILMEKVLSIAEMEAMVPTILEERSLKGGSNTESAGGGENDEDDEFQSEWNRVLKLSRVRAAMEDENYGVQSNAAEDVDDDGVEEEKEIDFDKDFNLDDELDKEMKDIAGKQESGNDSKKTNVAGMMKMMDKLKSAQVPREVTRERQDRKKQALLEEQERVEQQMREAERVKIEKARREDASRRAQNLDPDAGKFQQKRLASVFYSAEEYMDTFALMYNLQGTTIALSPKKSPVRRTSIVEVGALASLEQVSSSPMKERSLSPRFPPDFDWSTSPKKVSSSLEPVEAENQVDWRAALDKVGVTWEDADTKNTKHKKRVRKDGVAESQGKALPVSGPVSVNLSDGGDVFFKKMRERELANERELERQRELARLKKEEEKRRKDELARSDGHANAHSASTKSSPRSSPPRLAADTNPVLNQSSHERLPLFLTNKEQRSKDRQPADAGQPANAARPPSRTWTAKRIERARSRAGLRRKSVHENIPPQDHMSKLRNKMKSQREVSMQGDRLEDRHQGGGEKHVAESRPSSKAPIELKKSERGRSSSSTKTAGSSSFIPEIQRSYSTPQYYLDEAAPPSPQKAYSELRERSAWTALPAVGKAGKKKKASTVLRRTAGDATEERSSVTNLSGEVRMVVMVGQDSYTVETSQKESYSDDLSAFPSALTRGGSTFTRGDSPRSGFFPTASSASSIHALGPERASARQRQSRSVSRAATSHGKSEASSDLSLRFSVHVARDFEEVPPPVDAFFISQVRSSSAESFDGEGKLHSEMASQHQAESRDGDRVLSLVGGSKKVRYSDVGNSASLEDGVTASFGVSPSEGSQLQARTPAHTHVLASHGGKTLGQWDMGVASMFVDPREQR